MIARSPQAIAMALPPEDPVFTNFKASEVACAVVVIYGRGAGRFAGPTCIPFAHALPERLGQWVFVVSWQGGGGGLGENGAEGWEGGGAGAEVGFRGESGWVGVGGVTATTVVWMASHAHALRSRTRMSSSTNSPGRGWGRHRITGSYIFEFDFRPPVSSPFFLPSVPPFHPSVLLSLKRHTLSSLKRHASRLRRMFKTLQTNPYWFCL